MNKTIKITPVSKTTTSGGSGAPISIKKLTLPSEKSIPLNDLHGYSMFFYGKQGIGKTTFTVQFEDAIHIMFEPGAKSESIYQVHPESWRDVVGYANLLSKDTSNKYKYVVIDTIDLMFDMCAKDLCKEKGVEVLGDIGFGDGYSMAGNRFRDILIQLHRRRGLILLAHDKDKMKTKETDNDYIIPSTQKRGAETVAKWVDLCGHYYIKDNNKRYLRIRTSADREAKNRIKNHFFYTDGTPIMDIPMGNTEQEAYQNFMLAFENKLVKPEKNIPSVKTSKGKTVGIKAFIKKNS